jgi:hypothetical protein
MTTNETSRMVRWLVIVVLSVATAGLVAVSLRANYLFGYGFGQTPEKAHVFGWANVAADLWKVSGLIVITSLWRARQKRFAVSLMPIWALCFLWGLAGAIGIYAQDRTALIGGRETVAATYKDAERELENIDTKLRTLTQRSVAQVDAAIAAVMARPILSGERVRGTVGKLSANCTKEDRQTAESCLEVASLREERASAEEAARLQIRKAALRTQITKLREGGGTLPADPVSELFAWLSRGQLSVRDIGFGFPLVFAFLIEIVSAFGPAGIVAYAEATRRARENASTTQPDMASSGALIQAEARLSEHGRVVKWMAERTEPTGNTWAITFDELHADYEVWCIGKNVTATTADAFAQEFDRVREVPELAGKIRKFGRRYYGIRLVASSIAQLAPRNRQKRQRG